MNASLIVVLLVVFISSCQCGMLGLFNEWSDQLEHQNVDTFRKCRERRDTGENGIKPEITNSPQAGMVSLADIEEGRLTDETDTPLNSKTKRCPKDGFTGLVGKSLPGSSPNTPYALPLVKRQMDELNEEKCKSCTRDPTCILLKQCEKCRKFCGFLPAFVSDSPVLEDIQHFPESSRMSSAEPNPRDGSTLVHRVGVYKNELKTIISRIIGIKDPNDVESVFIYATTTSNMPPEVQQLENIESHQDAKELTEKPTAEPDDLQTEDMRYHLEKKKPSSSMLKPRFNDYDSGEDVHTFSKLRSLEPNVKENPDLIEGPPPFLRSSHDIDQQISETTTANKNDDNTKTEESIVGAPNEDLIVQPAALISEESDEDEGLSTAPVTRPSLFSKLKDIKRSKTSRFQRLRPFNPNKVNGEDMAATSMEPSNSNPENIVTSTPSPANPMPSLTLRSLPTAEAQHAAKQNGEAATEVMSGISKAIEDVKTMVKNIQEETKRASEKHLAGLSRFSTLPSEQDSLKQPEEELPATQTVSDENVGVSNLLTARDMFEEDEKVPETGLESNSNTAMEEEAIVGDAEPDRAIEGTPATKQYRTKVEKYLDELKERRQKMYSPEKMKKERSFTPGATEDLNEDPPASGLLTAAHDIKAQKEILRKRLEIYIRSMLRRQMTESPEDIIESVTFDPVVAMEEEAAKGYFGATPFNLSEQTDQVQNTEEDGKVTTEVRAGETSTESSGLSATTNGNGSKFYPTLPSASRNPLTKYVEELRAKSQMKPLGSKTPSLEARSGSSDESATEKAQKIMKLYHTTIAEPRRLALKDKLKNYMVALKKPLENVAEDLAEKNADELDEEFASAPTSPDGDPNKAAEENISNTKEEQISLGAMPPLTQTESRASFVNEDDANDWQGNLGKIIQYSSKPEDIYFSGNGIKLPMKIKLSGNDSLVLSVDLEKLCSCQNSSCPKNHAEVEETLGTILRKEAELESQLKDVEAVNLENAHTKQAVFKRSSDGAGKNLLENAKELSKQQTAASLPKLPTLQEIASDLSQLDSQLRREFGDSLQQMKKNADGLNKEVLNTLSATHAGLDPALSAKALETQLQAFKDLSAQSVKQLQKTQGMTGSSISTQNPLLTAEEYIQKLEKEKTLKKLLRQAQSPYLSPQLGLKGIENQAKAMKQSIEQQNRLNKLKNHISEDTRKLAKLFPTQNPSALADRIKENLKSSLPDIPNLQNRFSDVKDNLLQMPDVFQNSKIKALENELETLNNEIEKYEDSNGKLFADESNKFFGGHSNDVIQKEVNLIGKTLSWLNSLSKSN